MPETSPVARPPLSREPRAVPASHAIAWFTEAMRLWKRGPLTFVAMAVVVLLASVGAEPIPIAGFVAANVVAPLLACGLLYASLAADRDGRPRFMHIFAVFAAPLAAQASVVLAGFVALAIEAFVAYSVADVNILMPIKDVTTLPEGALFTIYAAGALATVPVTFVPMAALFDGESIGRAFAVSLRACALNVVPLLLLAAYSFGLILLGLASMGIGLLLAFPWIAAASYAAWKDVFGLAETSEIAR